MENRKKDRRNRLKSIIDKFNRDLEEIKKEEMTDIKEYMDSVWAISTMII